MAKDFDTIAEEQGWNDSTLVMILREYIDNQGDAAALADHARRIADEENAEGFFNADEENAGADDPYGYGDEDEDED